MTFRRTGSFLGKVGNAVAREARLGIGIRPVEEDQDIDRVRLSLQISSQISDTRPLGSRRDHGQNPPRRANAAGVPRAPRREAPQPQGRVERRQRSREGQEAEEDCRRIHAACIVALAPGRRRPEGQRVVRDWESTTPNAAMFTMSVTSTPR